MMKKIVKGCMVWHGMVWYGMVEGNRGKGGSGYTGKVLVEGGGFVVLMSESGREVVWGFFLSKVFQV